MTISSNESGRAFDACLQEGLRQSHDLIRHWCSALVDLLYERSNAQADPAQRRFLQNAVGALKENRAFIELGFVEQLASAVREDMRQGSVPDNASRSFSALSFDQLELMGDNQVQEAVEGARLQQVVKLASEAGLAGFSARLSSAQGFQRVKADKNPLRPELVAQTLFALLQSVPVTSQTRACWLGNGAQLMGEELQSFYVAMDKLLAGQGVAPAPYGVIASAPGRSATSPGPASESPAGPAQAANLSHALGPGAAAADDGLGQGMRNKLLTLDHLHRLLVGDYDASFKVHALASDHAFEEPVRTEFAHTVPAALDLLMELEEIAPVRPRAGMRTAPVPLAQMRAHLKTEAKSLGQSLAVEVVGLMIEQLANDSRLLMPVRQLIVNTEPAFLRLAVTDPRFFSDRNHPARCLLDAMTSASLAYASEDTAGFPEFMRSLQQTAALLTEEHAGDAQHFASLLQAFEGAQARQSQQYLDAQQRAVQALLQAEQRNLLAGKIASEIRARPDFVSGNRIITAFLTGPWSQVMARERLLGDYERAGAQKARYSRTLGDLLWSLDLAKVADHQKRLLKIIPDMLESLREGLLSIDYPLDQSRVFFDELMMIHQAGLRAVSEAGGMAGKHHGGFENMFASADAFEPSRPWLAPTEAKHSGFIDEWDEQGSPEPKAGLEPQAAHEGVALQLGDWVELLVDLQWLRAQLTWISPHNTLFMFTSEGGRKHSMTTRVLQHLLQLELVKLVSQQGVVEGALDGVARTAMRNSLGGGESRA